MKALDQIAVLEALCRATRQWGMFINIHVPDAADWEEIWKAAPYLDDHMQILADGCGIFLFDTETEMQEYYDQTVGDDGPTETNGYNGPASVYAITCNNAGQTMCNENT